MSRLLRLDLAHLVISPARLVPLVAAASLIVVAGLPTTTETLVDFMPQTVSQPLYVKLLAFIHRDAQMRELSARLVGEARDTEDKADRILRWTSASIRPTPSGMPIIDDHPYNVIIRGYGQPDQAADVFSTLAAYAGMPGGLTYSKRPDGRNFYAFAIVRIDGADRVFDVRGGRALRHPDGRLATVTELRADPGSLAHLPAPASADGVPYPVLIAHLESGPHRRATQHMLLSRILDELGERIPRW